MVFPGGPSTSARRPIKAVAGKVKAPRKHNEGIGQNLERLAHAIEQIQLRNASKLSFEEHYRYAYNLVLHKHGHELYNKVAELVTKHLESETSSKIVPVFPTAGPSTATATSSSHPTASTDDIALASAAQLFLDRLREVWDEHVACTSKLRDVLKYMDKVYTASSQLPSVWDLGLALFFHKVILYSTKNAAGSSAPPVSAKASGKAKAQDHYRPVDDPATVAHHLVKTLLAVIRIERDGGTVSRHSIAGAVDILSELVDEALVPLPVQGSQGMGSGAPVLGGGAALSRSKPVMGEGPPGERESPYKTSFEKVFLQQTSEYYERESVQLLIDCDAPTFLRKIERRLEEETTRAQTYLTASTEVLLVSLLEDRLINAHLAAVIEHQALGLPALIQESRIDDLKRMYRLFGRVGKGHVSLQAGLSSWIITAGRAINEGLSAADAAKDKAAAPEPGSVKTRAALSWVQNVLDLKDKTDKLLAEAFDSNLAFDKSINDAFSDFVNANKKSPEYISLFIDENLKKGLKGKSEDEVDDVLNRSVALFRFLVEKDTFERYYNSHLAKRLIGQRSVSDDAERNMLAKFKIEAGAAFAKAAEGMMKDIKISEDMVPEYRRHQERQAQKLPYDMVTVVCGSNFWPFATKGNTAKFPSVLLAGIDAFDRFYNTKHSGRKLTFRPELGTVEVKVRFAARSHDITLPTHAMIVLLLFERLPPSESLSYSDIESATEIAPAELKRILQSLACAKYKVLAKSPKGRDVSETDRFAFNDAFTCPLAKIKIQMIVSKVESTEERTETNEKIEEQRMAVCEATVVRIMKDRKTLQHGDLVNLVIAQINRFNPTPQLIKRAIERMIEKEYLERDETDRRKLRYLA